MTLNVGDVVVSKVAITDEDEYGRPYLHALPGTRGVVLSIEQPDFPCVAWEPEGHGVCNVPARHLTPLEGEIWGV